MKNTQQLATKVFIGSSLLFGITGVTAILIAPKEEDPPVWIMKLLMGLVFVILSSFGVSVGYKYLSK